MPALLHTRFKYLTPRGASHRQRALACACSAKGINCQNLMLTNILCVQAVVQRVKGEYAGPRLLYWLMVLNSIALITSPLWPWPLWIGLLYLLFPFFTRVITLGVLMPLPFGILLPTVISYGACELIIALGIRRMHDWSRKALIGLCILWITYGILDIAMPYNEATRYYTNPIDVAYLFIGGIVILYLHRQNIREYFTD